MRLRWTLAAADDLEAIANYLAKHFPGFRQIYETIATLRTIPYRGRIGREEGTRELVIARLPYIVVYRTRDEAVEILHIYHGAQQRP
jgi:plasmid stabilization system protein ParE